MTRCHHIWKVVSKDVLPSGWEQMAGRRGEFETTGLDIFAKDCIVHRRCETCGTEDVKRV